MTALFPFFMLIVNVLVTFLLIQMVGASDRSQVRQESRNHSKHHGALRRRLADPTENEHQLPWHHGHHFNHSGGGHKKAWMHFENVDGLSNEEVAVFVMSSAAHGGSLLRER